MSSSRIFKPEKSNGGKYITIATIGVAILLLTILISTYPALQNVSFLVLMLSIFIAIITIFSLLIYAYYEMEYIISNKFLLIKWGLKTTRIPIENVSRVVKPETNQYEGIRLGGVGIPGYLFGKFKYLIEGHFETVNLYATKLDKLLFIETNGQKKKIYGITPAQEDDFIKILNDINKGVETQVIEKPKSIKTTKHSSKDIKYALILFIISIILSIAGLTYFLVIYFQLPQTVPLHFSANFIPNRYGDKIDLLWIFLLFAIFGIALSSILYYYIHRRTHLDQTKYGFSIMLIPLVISTLFLILTIILMHMTLIFS